MKHFLREVARQQDELVTKVTRKKEADMLQSVAGARFEGGTISAEGYREIFDHIKNFSPEWRRLKNDSTKVVLEKNLFLNVLKKTGVAQLLLLRFTPTTDDVTFTVKVTDAFKEFEGIRNISRNAHTWRNLAVIFGIVWLFFPFIFSEWPYALSLASIASIPLFFLFNSKYRRYKALSEECRDKMTYDPKAIFSETYVSTSFEDPEPLGRITCRLSVTGGEDEASMLYTKLLQKMTILAAQFNGRIVWFWDYGLCSPGNYRAEHFSRYDTHIRISTTGMTLLPVIETEHSFIFDFVDGIETDYPTKDPGRIRQAQWVFEGRNERLFQTYSLK